jgi:hypothetical protein
MLSTEDADRLDSLDQRLQTIRDMVRGVAHHFSTGLWIWGEGGVGKSHTVLEELKASGANFVIHNTRLTGRGLFDTLQRFPDAIHLLEDCETLFDDRNALGVLRSALWSQSTERPMVRAVSWTAANVNLRFIFLGGIIITANRQPDSIPEIRAIKSRIASLQFIVTNDELAALMRRTAENGFRSGEDSLTPEECGEVADFLIAQTKGNLDLRLLRTGFSDCLLWKAGISKTHWEELLLARMGETILLPHRRADRVAMEAKLAVELSQTPMDYQERIRTWEEKTGHKGERSYYRALERASA